MLKCQKNEIQFTFGMVTLLLKTMFKTDNERKIRSETEISMKTISFNDSAKRSAFSAGYRPNDAE